MMIDNMADFLASCIISRTNKMPIFYNKFKIEEELNNIKDMDDYNLWFTCCLEYRTCELNKVLKDMIDINTINHKPIYNGIIVYDEDWKFRYRVINNMKQYNREKQALSNISCYLYNNNNNNLLRFLTLYRDNPGYNHKTFCDILLQMEKEGVFNV